MRRRRQVGRRKRDFALRLESLEERRILAAGPIITEFMADNVNGLLDIDGESSDWIEIFNPTAAPVNLAGYHLTDNAADLDLWTFPDVQLNPGAFLVVFASGKDRVDPAAELHTNFRLSLDGEYLALVAPDGATMQTEFAPAYPAQEEDVSYGVEQGVERVSLLTTGAPGHALIPTAVSGPALGTTWTTVDFDDAGWQAGPTAWGYDTQPTYLPFINTTLAGMQSVNPSAYLRTRFQVDDPQAISGLLLKMRFDDGFVAYVNGQLVASTNAPEAAQWNDAAVNQHADDLAVQFETFDISAFRNALVAGENVLAIHGLNFGISSSDFLMGPEIDATLAGAVHDQLGYFKIPTPHAANDTPPTAGFVADTKFSVDRGFFDAPFDLTITSDTPDAVIRYTTNGAVPTATTGTLYTGPIRISATTVLRAMAFKEGFEPSNVDAQTYLFLEDVIRQSPTGQPPEGWPARWGSNQVNYGMNQSVVNANIDTIKDDLKSIPSMSIVMNLDDLFGTQGIYSNPSGQGDNWERATSLELINPDGSEGFQINAGIRIRGGFSRSTSNPKHSFRFFFRSEYGDAKLNYPLFGDEGADEFDNIDFRTDQNYSWAFQGDSRQTGVREVFSRDTQRDMGQPYTRSRNYHLYINGQYWGLYQTQERAEAAYGETYFGGDKENYDVVKAEAGPYDTRATDGNLDAFRRFWEGANAVAAAPTEEQRTALYQRLMGNNPDGTRNPDYEVLLDEDNLIDYMLVIIYGGNLDAPISNFLGNTRVNNWFGMRDRTGGSGGWKFFAHDNEHTLLNVNENRVGPYTAGSSFTYANPQWIWQQLWASADFRLRVADRVQEHFFNGGALTPDVATARFMARAAEIDRAVVGESARWGDAQRSPAYTRDTWLAAINAVVTQHLPARSNIVVQQLDAKGLVTTIAAPTLNAYGGAVDPGFQLGISAEGAAYYTLDGSDPRLPGGGINPAALRVEPGEERVLFDGNATSHYFVPTSTNGGSQLQTTWTFPNFDDSGWAVGSAGIGFDRGTGYEDVYATDVESAFFDVNASIYTRTEFTVEDPNDLIGLNLRVKYDDGYMLWLNGTRIILRNAPTLRYGYNSAAASERPDAQALQFEFVSLTNFKHLLAPGRNVIAVQAMNRSLNDEDFLFVPELFTIRQSEAAYLTLNESTTVRARTLIGNQWSAEVRADFELPSPLRVTEIMYNPAAAPAGSPYAGSDFEFIELQNIGARPLPLSGYEIREGVEFTFGDYTLAPGAYVVVVNSRDAFQSRYGDGIAIAGEFDGNLSNSGERLQLTSPPNVLVQDFTFSDNWYATTDGAGLSLTIRDTSSPLESWNAKDAWKASSRAGGTPGASDAALVSGDTNGDGLVNLVDLNNVRNHFGAQGDVPGDTDGNGIVDLADLNNVRNNFGAGQISMGPRIGATTSTATQTSAMILPKVSPNGLDALAHLMALDAASELPWTRRFKSVKRN